MSIEKQNQTNMKRKKITGELINFRGLIWAPVNEQGVVFLFGMIAHELGLQVELVRSGYPDCIARRDIGKGRWEEVRVEFEFRSTNFKHDASECDMIVCWVHDWKNCPSHLEVIELKEEIKKLENVSKESPKNLEVREEYSLQSHTKKADNSTRKLFEEFENELKKINSSVIIEMGKDRIRYSDDNGEFIYVALRKTYLNITVCTWGDKIDGLESFREGIKWGGQMYIRSHADIPKVIAVIKRAIGNNVPIGNP